MLKKCLKFFLFAVFVLYVLLGILGFFVPLSKLLSLDTFIALALVLLGVVSLAIFEFSLKYARFLNKKLKNLELNLKQINTLEPQIFEAKSNQNLTQIRAWHSHTHW